MGYLSTGRFICNEDLLPGSFFLPRPLFAGRFMSPVGTNHR